MSGQELWLHIGIIVIILPKDNVLKVSFCDGKLSIVHRPYMGPSICQQFL